MSRGQYPRPWQVKTVRRSLAEFPPPTPQPTPCRLWQGATNKGYGVRADSEFVHRWVMRMAGHDIEGKFVLHRCDNPPCYRYEHLYVGTPADNNADMLQRRRDRHGVFLGERHGRAKLTEADVLAIRASTATQRQLAEQYGVGLGTIQKIRARETWRHI